MEAYKGEFIAFMLRCGVLRFGDFTTKSGRKTPYFFNTGRYQTGAQMEQLADFYAAAIRRELGDDVTNLYGPAYKGIPLCVTVAGALARQGLDPSFTFNRKEAKDHGEGGNLIGHQYEGGEKIVIVEDVTTAGTSIRETMLILSQVAPPPPGLQVRGVVVSVDRQEKGQGEKSALAELSDEYGFPCFAIVTLDEVIAYLKENPVDGKMVLDEALLERIAAYREQYGARKTG